MTTVQDTSSLTNDMSSRRRRMLEGIGFVAVWVALGYLLPVDADAYVVLGVPLTMGFQLLVRRRPLRELWVGAAPRLRLDRRDLVVAGLLMATPAWFEARALADGNGSAIGWYAAGLVGAVGVAYALRASSVMEVLRTAALPAAIGAGGMAVVLGGVHVADGAPVHPLAALGAVLQYTVLYFPVTFVLEEVAFRGALDAHVHHEGEGRGWQTAVFVSALWGLWHLPLSDGVSFPVLVAVLLAVHIFIGVPLSFAWRRTRNLAGPALAHSFIDAVRNALLLGL